MIVGKLYYMYHDCHLDLLTLYRTSLVLEARLWIIVWTSKIRELKVEAMVIRHCTT